MRATMRITWLLLTLGFLCQGVSSDDTTPASVTDAPSANTAATGGQTVTGGAAITPGSVTKQPTAQPATPAVPKTTQPAAQSTIQAVTRPNGQPTMQPATPPAGQTNTAQPTQLTANTPAVPTNPGTNAALTNPTPTVVSGPVTQNAVTPDAPSNAATPGQMPTPNGPPSSGPHTPAVAATLPPPATPATPAATVAGVPPGPSGTVGKTGATTVALPTGPSRATLDAQTSTGNNQGGAGGATITGPTPVQTTPKPTGAAPGPAVVTTRPPTPAAAGPAAAGTTGATGATGAVPAKTSPPPVPQQRTYSFSLNNGQESEEDKALADVCRRILGNMYEGNCNLTLRHDKGEVVIEDVEIRGKVKGKLATEYYKEITKTTTDNRTLIAILASCGALLIMIVILAVCASHHRKPYNENQQHLTEELHTVENGYHDNPTLEVMEVQPEMQEKKKMVLNGEFNDSWIVPMDNLKEESPEEEDTHL